jgi:hypothetical protein
MAEELSNQEQDAASSEEYKVSVKPPDYQALTENAKNIVADIKAGMNLPARPTAIDTYSNVAGNPITGSNPGSKKATSGLDYINALHSTVQAKAAESISPFAELRPYTYSGDMDASKFERYYATGDLYNKLGFSPYRDNESLYNNNMTFGDQFTRAAKQWDNLVGVGFMSGLRSWKTMFTDPLAPDIEGARDMERYTSIGSSSAGGLGGFFTNTFLNSAYTVGVGANLLAENLALMGVGTAVKGVTTALRAPAMLEKAMGAFKSADVVADFTKINPMDGVRALGETIPEARSFWNTIGKGAKKVGVGALDIINPLDNTIDALRAKDYATNYAKVAGTFGAFADDMLMMKAAVSEAKLEGGMSKINITKDLIEDYRQRNGRDPEGVDLTNIEKIADEKAHTVAFWNMPAIMTSNKLLYATMLAPLRKVMGKQVAGTVDDYILKDKTYSVLGEDFISRAGAAVKSLGKPNTYGKFGMNYLTANFAEGIQENIQEALSEGASQHALELFRDPIKANYEGYMPYFLKGIKSQFSAQGAETFAGGFLMGAFAQPIMAAPSIGISKIIEAATTDSVRAKELEEERAKHKAETAETLTEFYNNTLNYLAPDLPNAVRTGRLSDDMFSAARVGDKLGTISAQEAIKNHHIITAARTGKLDVMIDRAKDYKNLTKEEAVEAFGKYGVEAQDVDKAMAHIDGIVERAKEIKDDFEDVANRYPNPFNPSNFRIGSPEFIAAAVAKTSWDEAAHNLIFAKATFKSHSKRIADIANTFSKLSSALAKGDVNLLTSMLSSTTMTNEINMLRKEIATLNDSLPEQSKIKKQKLKHLEGIQAFYKAIENYQYAKTDAEKAMVEKRAKDAFAKHLKNIADKNDVPVFDEELDAAFSLIRDHMLLKDQQTGLVKNINVLMTPDSFFQFQKRLYSTYAEGVYNIPDTIGHNLDRHTFTKDLNDIINDIRGLGFNIPQDVIASYSDAYFAGEELLPLVFLLDSNGVKITSGPAFEKANGIWNTFIELTSKKRKTIEAMEYDQDNFLTYPEELKQILTDEYNDLSDEIKAAQNLEDWATGDANIGIRKLFFEGRAAETQGIEERYKSMTIPELTTALEELAEQAKTDPKLDAKVTVLQDYIAYRAVEAVDMPEKQKQALRNMKAQAANTQNRDKDNEKYILNGKKLDTRVTTVVQEILAKKYGLSPFNFPNTGYGKEILKDQKDMLEQLIEEKQDKNIIVNIWADTVSNTRTYKERWDDSKTALLKETLKEKFTYEDFEKAVSSLAYQESKTGGNTVDEIARNFLTGTPISKPGNMTQEAFNKLRGILKGLMNTIRERGEIILAKDLFLKGEVIIDGVKQTIGGEMDMLVIDKDGNLKIYDFKTGRNYKWEMYGTEADEKGTDTKDPTLYKKGYGLQLSLYKRLIEEQTGLTVDSNKLTIVPFIINVSNNGMINDIELSNEDKNIIHEYNPVVEEYIPVTKTAAYSPQPFVQAIEVINPKLEPTPLSTEEVKVREANSRYISKKIDKLKEKSEILGRDANAITDTISYLQELLDNTIELTDLDLKQLQQQINILSNTVKSSTASKTKRGLRAIENITELKKAYKSEFQLLNDIADRIKDLKENLSEIEAAKKDFEKQAAYYTSLVNDPNIRTITRDELQAKKDAIEGKINTIQKLIDGLKEAIVQSIKYIREYVKNIFAAENNLKKFSKATGYKELSKEEINKLINSNLEEDRVFLENYPALKDKFNNLENTLIENLDAVDFLEEVKESEEKRQEQLVNSLQRYQDQLRYLDELMTPYKQIDLNSKGVPEKMVKQQPKPEASKTEEKKKATEEKIKAETKKKEVIQGELIATSKPTVTTDAKADIEAAYSYITTRKYEGDRRDQVNKVGEDLAKRFVATLKDKGLVKEDFRMAPRTDGSVEKVKVNTDAEGNNLGDDWSTAGKFKDEFKKFINAELAALEKPIKAEAKELTISEINADLNLESLKQAKTKKLEVEYKGNRYKIKKVEKKSVTLEAPNRDDVKLDETELAKELTVVEPGVKKTTTEETEQVVKNENLVNTTERVFEEIPTDKSAMDKAVNKRKDDFLNNLCI